MYKWDESKIYNIVTAGLPILFVILIALLGILSLYNKDYNDSLRRPPYRPYHMVAEKKYEND